MYLFYRVFISGGFPRAKFIFSIADVMGEVTKIFYIGSVSSLKISCSKMKHPEF